MPPSKRKSTEENDRDARARAIAVYDEFEKSYKRLQKLWMDNEKEDAMRRAKVWASYKRLGTLIDDEGPWRKALDAILEKGQI
tara:strand:+ start:201 stop:449 length:249 start_codon:yes stop_codon:yes gene_type:complete